MTTIPMGGGGEFDQIRAISQALGRGARGLGGDVAVLAVGEGNVVASTDMSIEGVHFRREWLSYQEIGWRATAAALSDLAAAGATATGVLLAVGVPTNSQPDDLLELMRGAGACAESVGSAVIGGDLSTAPVWSITVTVLGQATAPLSRVGANVGDSLWVSGTLGGAHSALTHWLRNAQPSPAARGAFAHPVPRLPLGVWLAANGATALMDLSDGLAGDAPHLASASAVGLEISLDHLPLHPSVVPVAREVGQTPAFFAAVGGEDYELLVTLPSDWDLANACEAETGVPLTRIGAVVAGTGVRFMEGGQQVTPAGYRHLLGTES